MWMEEMCKRFFFRIFTGEQCQRKSFFWTFIGKCIRIILKSFLGNHIADYAELLLKLAGIDNVNAISVVSWENREDISMDRRTTN